MNHSGVTHPSEPNYVATIGGDYFGMDNDNFNRIPANISSLIDLLEDKGISWGHYQEDMPYSGFEGIDWVNQHNGANDYVRKHSEFFPLSLFVATYRFFTPSNPSLSLLPCVFASFRLIY